MDVELIFDAFKEARLGNKIQMAEGGKEAIEFLKDVKTVSDYWLTLNVEPPLD